MSPLRRVLARVRRDDGVTLAEMAVTTSIMSVVMAIFTTGVVQLFNASNDNELLSLTQSQLNTAFLRLDRNLRYAAGISEPRQIGKDWRVEYVNTDTPTGEPECAQLELNEAKKVLRRQVWPQTTKPTGRWVVLANQVNAASSRFELVPPATDTGFQRLRILLFVATNPGSGHTEARTDITFTALNSTRGTLAKDVCPEARAA